MKHKSIKALLLRTISAICIAAICLTFFVGCSESNLGENVIQIENDLTTANAELEKLQSSYDALLEQNKALNTANDDSKKEIDALKASNESALKEIEDLKKQLSNITSNTPENTTEKIRIYIDQGHNPTGYHNSGAAGNNLYEENITFAVGIILANLLLNDGRFEVCLSRPTSKTVLGADNDSSLEARVQGAKDFNADYFISLHTNSFETPNASGIEIYTAKGSADSYVFATYLLDGVAASTKLRAREINQELNLHVLVNATMPATLVELGFISNENDARLLSENPELFAQGLYDGISNYFNFPPTSSAKN